MARPVTFPITGTAAQNAASLNGMQDSLRSNLVVYGSQGAPITGAPAVITADLAPSATQLHGLVIEVFVGSDAALALQTDGVASGEESWLTLVFRQVGGPWELVFFREPFTGWTILTEGDATLLPSTTADAIDVFDLWTPNGADWFGSVSKDWS